MKPSDRIAMTLMKYQDQMWIHYWSKTPLQLLEGMDLTADKLFKESAFGRRIVFAFTYVKNDEEKPLEHISRILSFNYGYKNLAKALIAAPTDAKWSFVFPELLKLQRKKWTKSGISAKSAYEFLKPDKPYTKWRYRLFISSWLDYMQLLGANDAQIFHVFRSKYSMKSIRELLGTRIHNDPLKKWIKPLSRASKNLNTGGVIPAELGKKIWSPLYVD